MLEQLSELDRQRCEAFGAESRGVGRGRGAGACFRLRVGGLGWWKLKDLNRKLGFEVLVLEGQGENVKRTLLDV